MISNALRMPSFYPYPANDNIKNYTIINNTSFISNSRLFVLKQNDIIINDILIKCYSVYVNAQSIYPIALVMKIEDDEIWEAMSLTNDKITTDKNYLIAVKKLFN